MACLEVTGLTVSPGRGFRTAPLTFTVDRGEILSLVGPSGCGKTTLIRALAGLLAPTAGRVVLEGVVLNDPAPRVSPGRRRVGMVFQSLALWPHLSALDQVAFAVRERRGRREKALALLRRLGLEGKERARPAQLSGGEGQRVALARALAGEPALLLLDEPLRSVDPHLRGEIGALLREIVRERQVACLLVTHDREEALGLGDRVAVMRAGEWVGVGTPAELLQAPPHPFVRQFLQDGGALLPAPDAAPAGPPPRRGPGPAARAGLLALLAGGAAAAAAGLGTRDPGAVRPPAFASSAQCAPCHREVYDEWAASWHAQAWTDPEVRKLSNDFRNRECLSCHAPMPVLLTGLDQRVLPRATRLVEGVDCLACHLDGAGRIVGTRDLPTAPCAPVRHDAVSRVELCAPCHNQHQTLDQWRESPAGRRGEGCNECHMPAVDRRLPDGTVRRGRSHLYPAAHHPEFLRPAVELEAKLAGGQVRIAVKNVFAGHNFPTDSRHKASDVLVRFRSGATWGAWRRVARFRQPYKEEPGPNTQLLAGERRELEPIPVPPGTDEVEVRLDYRATPFVPDEGALEWDQIRLVPADKAVVLHRRSLEVP